MTISKKCSVTIPIYKPEEWLAGKRFGSNETNAYFDRLKNLLFLKKMKDRWTKSIELKETYVKYFIQIL